MTTQILQGNVILPDAILARGLVVIEDSVIQAVTASASYRPTDDLGEHYIAPGFIDLHTHGIAGADTMDATREALATMARQYARHGVTGFLPTTMTQSFEATARALSQVRRYMDEPSAQEPGAAQVLGLHLEGPWISRQAKGAQNERYIAEPSPRAIRDMLAQANGALRKVTIAPELPGAEQAIAALREHGIHISIGHTAASYEQAQQAIAWGATQVTHCFNCMTPLHHRQPGVVGAVLLRDELTAELIADGVHVHQDVMRLLIGVKSRERVMLVTDSISATGLSDGMYSLGGQEVYVRAGQARLADGTLAGSTLTFDQAVRNLVTLCGVPLRDAVYMGATTPARAIGLDDRKGRIAPGYDADLAILDADLRARRVMVGGSWAPIDA